MSRAEALAVRRFLARHRRRLWLRGLQGPMRRAAGAGAAALLLAGLVHRHIQALPPLPCLGLALLPPAACALAGLARGLPSAEAAAVAADRQFAGKSLMTTAAGLLDGGAAAGGPLAARVLRSAARAAEDWGRRPDGRPTASPVLWAAAAAALAGAFLLAQTPPAPASAPTQEAQAAPSRLEDPAGFMAALAAAPEPPPEAAAPGRPAPADAAPQAGAADTGTEQAGPGPDQKSSREAVGGGFAQGEGAGAGADARPRLLAEPGTAQFAARRVDIARRGGGAGRGGPDFARPTAAPALAGAAPPPAAAAGGPGFSRLSAAQRQHAAAYFRLLSQP